MPPKSSPFAEAKADFFGEPPPSRFFANTPVGFGRTSFSPSINAAAAAGFQEQFEDYEMAQNKRATDLMEGGFRRQQLQSQAKILPFSTAAQIAQSRLNEQSAQADIGLIPQQTQFRRSEMQYGTAQNQAALEDLPETRQYQQERRQAEIEDIRRQDPYAQRLGRITDKPQHLFAYESFLENAPMALREDERRKMAMNEALRLAADEPYIQSILEADTSGLKVGALDVYTEPVVDPGTGMFLGRRLKSNAPRNEVERLVKSVETQKERSKMEMDERKESRLEYSARVNRAERRSKELADQIREATDPEEIKALKAKKAAFDRIVDEDLEGTQSKAASSIEKRMSNE